MDELRMFCCEMALKCPFRSVSDRVAKEIT